MITISMSLFILFLLCLFAFGVLFRKTIRDKVNRKMIFVFFGVLFILVFLFAKVVRDFVPLPTGTRHFAHLLFAPEDLYKPIVNDDFPFYENGFTKTYMLKPKYLDFYHIGFSSKNQNIPVGDTFKGRIKAEFFWGNKFLFEKISTSQIAAQYAGTDMKHYKEVSLMDFEIPLQGKYKDNISVRLTVLEPDEGMRKYGDSITLFIGVSGLP